MNDSSLLKLIEKHLDLKEMLNESRLKKSDVKKFFAKIHKALNIIEKPENEKPVVHEPQVSSSGQLSFSDAGLNEMHVYTDGASKGNPGPASIGGALYDIEGNEVRHFSMQIGKATNNVAEYKALIFGVDQAARMKADKIKVFSDSQLLVFQVSGKYKVKNPNISPLFNELMEKLKQFGQYEIIHVPREKNKRADQLANEAFV